MDEPKKIEASSKKHSVVGDLGKYVMEEYIAPKSMDILHDMLSGLCNMINDSAQGALNKAIYKEDKPVRRTNNGQRNVGFTTYSISANQQLMNKRDSIGNRSSVNVDYIWVNDENAARDMISRVKDLVVAYGKAKVSDIYGMVNPPISPSFTDFKYGWTDWKGFGYHKEYTGDHRGQYLIDFPQAEDVSNV
jgi:hypothetical protein